MRRFLMMSTLLLVPSLAHAFSPPRGGGTFGLGLGGGFGVAGVSGKYWFSHANAIQGMIGGYGGGGYYAPHGRYGYYGNLGLGVDYLWEMPSISDSGPLVLAWNVGAGVSTGIGSEFFLAVSGVVGLEFNIQPVPIDIVLEYRPGIFVSPFLGFDPVDFSGHIRFYFM